MVIQEKCLCPATSHYEMHNAVIFFFTKFELLFLQPPNEKNFCFVDIVFFSQPNQFQSGLISNLSSHFSSYSKNVYISYRYVPSIKVR